MIMTQLLPVYRMFQGECDILRNMYQGLNYTDVTINTCIQSSTFMEMMAREKCDNSVVQHTVAVYRGALSVNCTGSSLSQSRAMRCMCYVKYLEP